MTTRRDFIKAAGASGIVFCGCAMRDVARSQGSDGQRLPVTVNGKRIKTIDVHAHSVAEQEIARSAGQDCRRETVHVTE